VVEFISLRLPEPDPVPDAGMYVLIEKDIIPPLQNGGKQAKVGIVAGVKD